MSIAQNASVQTITNKSIKLILYMRQSVLMPAAHDPLTYLNIQAERPGKTRSSRPTRNTYPAPIPPCWVVVQVTEHLIYKLHSAQATLKSQQWSEIRIMHPMRFGYSQSQWGMLGTQRNSSSNDPDSRIFKPAVAEFVVLADRLTITACDQNTGITVESLAFNDAEALEMLKTANHNDTLYHPDHFTGAAQDHYAPDCACPSGETLPPEQPGHH